MNKHPEGLTDEYLFIRSVEYGKPTLKVMHSGERDRVVTDATDSPLAKLLANDSEARMDLLRLIEDCVADSLDRKERETAEAIEAIQTFAAVWKALNWKTDGHGSGGLDEHDNNRLDNAVDALLAAAPGEGE